jgi:hypothetical protein
MSNTQNDAKQVVADTKAGSPTRGVISSRG